MISCNYDDSNTILHLNSKERIYWKFIFSCHNLVCRLRWPMWTRKKGQEGGVYIGNGRGQWRTVEGAGEERTPYTKDYFGILIGVIIWILSLFLGSILLTNLLRFTTLDFLTFNSSLIKGSHRGLIWQIVDW